MQRELETRWLGRHVSQGLRRPPPQRCAGQALWQSPCQTLFSVWKEVNGNSFRRGRHVPPPSVREGAETHREWALGLAWGTDPPDSQVGGEGHSVQQEMHGDPLVWFQGRASGVSSSFSSAFLRWCLDSTSTQISSLPFAAWGALDGMGPTETGSLAYSLPSDLMASPMPLPFSSLPWTQGHTHSGGTTLGLEMPLNLWSQPLERTPQEEGPGASAESPLSLRPPPVAQDHGWGLRVVTTRCPLCPCGCGWQGQLAS